MTYGASIPKIGILLAYFQLRPEAVVGLDSQRRRELGQMIKRSSNEMAAKYSQDLGLKQIQEVLCSMGFYDAHHGGCIWLGKHYGVTGERIGDPIADLSHAVTVRQVLRFYLALGQCTLISPSASATMRKIFESPDIPHERNKFDKGLQGRDVQIIRKSGSWGHTVGDEVLRNLAGQLRDHIRYPDTVGRYGGEEFLILLPNSGIESAVEQASRLCTYVRTTPVETDGQNLHVTISIGIAQYRIGHENWQNFLSRADAALYQAKHKGRDQWVVAEE